MTISLGLICKRSMVLATDMQESFRESSHKTSEADKMAEVDFSGTSAVIVMSGGLDYYYGFLETLEDLAERTTVTTQRTIPDAVERAIADEKRHIRKQAIPAKGGATWDKIFRAQGFDLLIAFYHNQQTPCFYQASFVDGRVRPVTKKYGMTGSPQVLVDYLLDGISSFDLTTTEGMALAAYIVQAAKNHDQFCGGPTRMAIVYRKCPWILSQHEIAPFSRAANQLEFGMQGDLLNALKKQLPKNLEDTYDHDQQ